ncbi:MAG: dihydroneopterin aldolase [Akkermansiaceae bacterium]|nr:dihydroneopterin aldolase [Akkermansiaceae bacterium]
MNEGWIHVRGLKVETRIGVPDDERARPQELLLDISMRPPVDFSGMADGIEKTLDYHAACLAIADLAATGERKLVETLADETADLLLGRFGAVEVRVEIRKFILPQTEWVGVSLRKSIS